MTAAPASVAASAKLFVLLLLLYVCALLHYNIMSETVRVEQCSSSVVFTVERSTTILIRQRKSFVRLFFYYIMPTCLIVTNGQQVLPMAYDMGNLYLCTLKRCKTLKVETITYTGVYNIIILYIRGQHPNNFENNYCVKHTILHCRSVLDLFTIMYH